MFSFLILSWYAVKSDEKSHTLFIFQSSYTCVCTQLLNDKYSQYDRSYESCAKALNAAKRIHLDKYALQFGFDDGWKWIRCTNSHTHSIIGIFVGFSWIFICSGTHKKVTHWTVTQMRVFREGLVIKLNCCIITIQLKNICFVIMVFD